MQKTHQECERAAARLSGEPLVTAKELSRDVGPELSKGRGTVSEQAVRRWMHQGRLGADGVHVWLDCMERAGIWFTSRPALRRFILAVCGELAAVLAATG